jgi:rubredoxin
MEEYLTIATFNERAPADLLTTRLREAGFNADVFDESQAQKWLLLNLKPRAHMRVRVLKEEGDRALQTLAEWDKAEGVLRDSVRCPQCGSSRIEYPQFSRRTLMSALPAAAAAVGIIEREYYCEACGYTWEAEPKPQKELDVLNWSSELKK